jgi:hypothetical protein
VNDGEKLHRWGLVRFLKDSQRLHNYWRSVLAEQLIAVPRNKWLTTPDAIKGHEAQAGGIRRRATIRSCFTTMARPAADAHSAAGARCSARQRSRHVDAGFEGYLEYPRSFARNAEQRSFGQGDPAAAVRQRRGIVYLFRPPAHGRRALCDETSTS